MSSSVEPISLLPSHSEMVASRLPTEIVEHIIDMLFGDTETLLSCSVISTSWTHRCRYHLFAELKLYSLSDLCFWFSTGMGPSSHHVRSLDLAQNNKFKWITPKTLSVLPHNFDSFHNVQSLSLAGLDLTLFDENSLTHFFGHFSDHLTSLSVEGSIVHPAALLFFICMFPKLDHLKLDHLAVGMATVPFRNPTVTPSFRGKLTLTNIKSGGTSMIAFLADLPIAFEDVCVENCRFETPKPLNDLFAACRETMKKVKVVKIFFGEFDLHGTSRWCRVSSGPYVLIRIDNISQTPLVDLSPCQGLAEMQLSLIQLRRPSHWIEPILQTVTSTRVRRITFDTDFPSTTADIDSGIDILSWSRLDTIFMNMADVLCQADGRLELVFNALVPEVLGKFNPVYPGRFLEGCRTKATVRFERI